MPSWIKEKDGIEWYDELYTVKETNQSPEQLAKKVKAKQLRRFKQRNGGYWYARPDVEALREAYSNRRAAAKKRKVSDKTLEARYSRQWEREVKKDMTRRRKAEGSYGPGRVSVIVGHLEKAMLYDIDLANAKRAKAKEEGGEESE
jgi:hypothetical protein